MQLQIDTGARLGCDLADSRETAVALQAMPNLNLAGVYSHLACADEPDDPLTTQQQQRFCEVIASLPREESTICRHLANSAGTLLNRNLHHDLVRVGLALYGHAPAPHLSGVIPLQPALAVRAR